MEYQYANVFLFKGTVFVQDCEYVGGPDRGVWPARAELVRPIEPAALGDAALKSLEAYQDRGRVVHADEWEILNQQLLDFFGEKSVSAFERKKKGITVRRDTGAGRVTLIGRKDKEIELDNPNAEELGQAIMGLLGFQ